MAKFIQIAATSAEDGDALYALDENGDVFTRDWEEDCWVRIGGKHIKFAAKDDDGDG